MKNHSIENKWIRIPLKILMWILAGVIALIILLLIIIQFSAVQNFAASKAVNYLEEKLQTTVELKSINIGFPKTVQIKGLFVADKQNDTLLYAGEVNVGVDMMAILKNKLNFRSVELKNITGKVYRLYPDTAFNYSFIVDAFAGEEPAPAQTDTAQSMVITFNEIDLQNVHLLFSDTLAGLRTSAFIGEFQTQFKEFDLNEMIFHVSDVLLKNSSVTYLETPALVASQDTSAGVLPDIGFEKINLENFSFAMWSPYAGNELDAKIGDLNVNSQAIDLAAGKFALEEITLMRADINFEQTKPQRLDTIAEKVIREKGVEKQVATPNWEFTVGNMEFADNNLSYRNHDSVPKEEGMDFNHILVTNFALKTSSVYATPGKITLDLEHMALEERSGFKLEEFSSSIYYDTTRIAFSDLVIATPSSVIKDHLEVNFDSLAQLSANPERVNLNINLNDSRIALQDVLYFMPANALPEEVQIGKSELIDIQAGITGTLNDLAINGFRLDNNKQTNLSFTAKVVNALNTQNLYAEVSDLKFNTTSGDIKSYVDNSLLPADISIPGEVSLNADFRGYLKNFNANADVTTSFGSAAADIKMNPAAGNKEVNYEAQINVTRFDLGKLLQQPDTLGPVTLEASIDGRGFNPDSLNAEVLAVVNSAFYNGYEYNNLTVEGFVVNRSYHGEVFIKDENVDFNYTGYVNAHPDSLAAMFDLQLNKADLKALHLSEDELTVKGYISSDLAKRYGPNPLGKLKIFDIEVKTADFICPFDSLVVESTYDYDSSVIKIRSQFLNAVFSGDIVLQYLPQTLMQHLNRYYQLVQNEQPSEQSDTLAQTEKSKSGTAGAQSDQPDQQLVVNDTVGVPQDFRFSIVMEDPNYICENLVPGLKKYIPATVTGIYNSNELKLEVDAEIPLLDYNGLVMDDFNVEVNTNPEQLEYRLTTNQISNPQFSIEDLLFEGNVANDTIIYAIEAAKADTFTVLNTSGAFIKNEAGYRLIMDEPLVLSNTAWKIDPDNVINFTEKGLTAEKVVLSGGSQLLSIITQPGDDIPLKIAFERFKLANFSRIIEKEEQLARGELNGHFILFKVNGAQAFTSDLSIDSLRFRDIPVGNIALMASNSNDPSRFDVDLDLTGYGNDLSVTGNYIARDSTNRLDLNVDIPHLNMSSVQPFTFGQVSRMEGFINGNINISGTTENPDPVGFLRFNDVAFNAPYANTFLRLNNNTINVRDQRLVIDKLVLTDTLNNTATLTGNISFSDLTNPSFDLRITTDNFLAMDAPKKQAEEMPVYGTVFIDSDIRVRGSASNPVVDMNVRLNDGTKVTYVLPEEEMTLNESEGVVIFTDSLQSGFTLNGADTAYNSAVEGISLDASITFQPEAVLKMLVDPVAGDSLFVSGEGTLNFSLEPGGQMNLTGNYVINSGGYNLTINNLIKREFSIAEGSTITWTGDIMDALVDLNAIYTVRASPLNLLEDQVEGMDEMARNAYRNNLTFMVYLKMEGKLTEPEISFDIEQPDDEKGALNGAVNARLNELKSDESQLNKQVFALLTLNRFIGQDPFESGSSPLTVESATRASASKVLTEQFNALSEKYIKGVDLDVGVRSYEDYSTGEEQGRTQLQLGLSKELLNDRLMVQVGGNVELEGDRARTNNVSNLAGNVNIEYKLTPKGRYRLRAFRRIEYENPIEGEIINTGIGISYSRDFRSFKQLFMSEDKRREWIRQRIKEREEQEQKQTRLNESDAMQQPNGATTQQRGGSL